MREYTKPTDAELKKKLTPVQYQGDAARGNRAGVSQ